MIEHKYYINVLMGKPSKEWKERRGKREKLPKKEQALHHERIPTWEKTKSWEWDEGLESIKTVVWKVRNVKKLVDNREKVRRKSINARIMKKNSSHLSLNTE